MASFAMMRLASPSLPIGGFSYSQGLEAAIEAGWITNERTTTDWLIECVELNVGRFEAPICHAMFSASLREANVELQRLHTIYLASRETSELLAETKQMGYSLIRLLSNLDGIDAGIRRTCHEAIDENSDCSLPLAWAYATRAFGLSANESLAAYLWAWLENQVAAAIKTVPLGQQAGQKILSQVSPALTQVAQRAAHLPEQDWSNFSPGLVLASCRHEQQYSRLFRS